MSRKFKLMKSFQPCAVATDDELYPNGIFEFNVTKLIAFVRANPDKFPIEEVDVEEVRWGDSDDLDEATIQAANLSNPIILAEISPDNFNVIDGNHRLERAYRDKVEKIPAFRVLADQHLAFLTSERAYRSYIEYWNSKVDDLADR